MSEIPPKDDSNDGRSKREERREALHEFYDSAIEAERLTGRKETEPDDARRSLIVRVATIFLGSVVALLGLMMLVLPGPGLIVLALGLGILAKEVAFAQRLLNIVRNRLPQDESGELTKGTIATMIILAAGGVIFTAVSLYFTFWAK